jgi:hypothetical protein
VTINAGQAAPDAVQEKAKAAAESPDNAAERDRNQRRGVDDDQPAQNSETKAEGTRTANHD